MGSFNVQRVVFAFTDIVVKHYLIIERILNETDTINRFYGFGSHKYNEL